MPFGQHQDTELWNRPILVPRAHDLSGLRQRSRALAWSNTGSPRFTDFPSNLIGREYETNALHILRKSGPARAVDPRHRPEGSWTLGTRMPETKILGLPASRRMRDLVYMAFRDKVDVDTFYKSIQYALERLGKSKFGFESTTVSNFKSKSHEGSGNELVDYSRAPCLGAD